MVSAIFIALALLATPLPTELKEIAANTVEVICTCYGS